MNACRPERVESPMRRFLTKTAGYGLALAALLFGVLWAAAASAREANAAATSPVRILIESPKSGEALRNKVHQAPIRGSAAADGERPADFDVMVVVDVSGSTQAAARTLPYIGPELCVEFKFLRHCCLQCR